MTKVYTWDGGIQVLVSIGCSSIGGNSGLVHTYVGDISGRVVWIAILTFSNSITCRHDLVIVGVRCSGQVI